MPTQKTLQIIIIPHRPTPTDDEINRDLAPAMKILSAAPGVQAIWRGKKHEERYTQIALVLWDNLVSSHAFFTSPTYREFHTVLQPAMNGRLIDWQNHVLIERSELDTLQRLKSTIVNSGAIEVALTKVVEGGVAGYYERFRETVVPILENEEGCFGYFIHPLLENPQDQLLLINWASVDAHHEDFEKRPTFKACITALKDYYKVFVVPWHIVDLKLAEGQDL